MYVLVTCHYEMPSYIIALLKIVMFGIKHLGILNLHRFHHQIKYPMHSGGTLKVTPVYLVDSRLLFTPTVKNLHSCWSPLTRSQAYRLRNFPVLERCDLLQNRPCEFTSFKWTTGPPRDKTGLAQLWKPHASSLAPK